MSSFLKHMLKAILFDLDGTLIDSETYYTSGTLEWLANENINLSLDEVSSIIGLTMESTYAYLSKVTGLNEEVVIKKNSEYFDSHPLMFNKYLFDDVKPFIEKIKKLGYKICICSISPKEYIERFIRECGLGNYIDLYISGDECEHNKPSPEIYNRTIEKLGIDKKEALIVEDSNNGILSGLGSGAYVVARSLKKFNIKQNDSVYIFDDIDEVTSVIERINDGKYN